MTSRVFILLSLAAAALGLPSYRDRLPNSRRVACPDGTRGCSAATKGLDDASIPELCGGLGHFNCEGGSLPLNVFGVHFMEAGFYWTRELCERDSDGDGQTNGEELGTLRQSPT